MIDRQKDTPRGDGDGLAGESAGERPGEGPAPRTETSSPTPPPAPSTGEDDSPSSSSPEEQVVRERDEYLELARRTKADFENYRKRVGGEAREAEKRGRASLAKELLPVLDNLERALAAAEPRDEDAPPNHLSEGVRLVREELAGVLKRSGIESYEPTGEPFDPHLHEAMLTRPVEGEGAGTVLEVLEKGYRLDGQVLRPARVVVGAESNGAEAD